LQVVCPINTTELDTTAARRGRPLFLNGAHTIDARLVSPAGVGVGHATKTLQFRNRDYLQATTNATGGDSLSARGAEFAITVRAVAFTTDTTTLFATLTASSEETTAPLVFSQTTRTQLPATFTVDAAASASAEGFYRLEPRIFDQAGTERTGQYDLSKFLRGVVYDLAAPRFAILAYPPGEIATGFDGLVLNYDAGSYVAGDTVPLSRITGGVDSAPHPPGCTYRHMHGNISLQRAGSSDVDGPFTDPQTTSADPCGWGAIVSVADSILRFSIDGRAQDRATTNVTIRLYLATGGCDAGPIVDDVPVAQGNGVGQSPAPAVNFPQTTGGFTAQFQMRVDFSMLGRVVCTVVQAADQKVTLSGQPAANTSYLVYPSFIKGN
jgi:hypothetical protein